MSDPVSTSDEQVAPEPGADVAPEPAVDAEVDALPDDAAPADVIAGFESDVPPTDGSAPSIEDILGDLERVTAERGEYLLLAQSKQAELENLRKRVAKQQADEVARRTASVVRSLLPVLDAFDYGVAHGDESLKPLQSQLLGVLRSEGLERVGEAESPFDPEQHEAVAHEPGEGDQQVVAEVLRAGYRWQGHLVRPAMVRVRG
jgi:molecular chaperone GrpE